MNCSRLSPLGIYGAVLALAVQLAAAALVLQPALATLENGVAPGFIYLGDTFQFGIEALIPANAAAGSHVGVIAQLHFFFDDLFPKHNREADPAMIIRRLAATPVAVLAGAASAQAHAFLTRAVPPVGGRVATPPAELKAREAVQERHLSKATEPIAAAPPPPPSPRSAASDHMVSFTGTKLRKPAGRPVASATADVGRWVVFAACRRSMPCPGLAGLSGARNIGACESATP